MAVFSRRRPRRVECRDRILSLRPEKADCKKQSAFFSYIRPPRCGVASSMHFVRDIAFGSDMRFARWKLQGEYNITAKQSGAISLLRSKNITLSVRSISLNSLQLVAFCF